MALYLGHLASTGRSIATVQQTRSAISHFHAAAGMRKGDNPALHPVVTEAVKGWRNRAPAPRQAAALTADALARVREVLRLPRRGRGGRMESAKTAQRRAALDLADGGIRRSEATALTWGDVELWPDGIGRLTIQKGKNQVEPATVAVTPTTARALGEIRPEGVGPTAPVFGLTGEALANRVRAAAQAAGLGDGFSGHSGRIGMARRMAAAGAPNEAVQNQGRWKHGDMVARYTRGEAAGETPEDYRARRRTQNHVMARAAREGLVFCKEPDNEHRYRHDGDVSNEWELGSVDICICNRCAGPFHVIPSAGKH